MVRLLERNRSALVDIYSIMPYSAGVNHVCCDQDTGTPVDHRRMYCPRRRAGMTDKNDDTEPTKDAEEPEQAASGATEPEPEPEKRRRGSFRQQDAETTTPREPTLAEKRAMRKALEEQEQDRVELAEIERKSLRRRRVMIGAGVTVGVAATVALWYSAASPSGEVTASCVDDSSTLSSDENICTDDYVTSHGGYSSGGIFFLPYGGGYRQYHYYYGGSVDPGTRHVSGGTTAAPSSRTTVKSTSGSTVQRGGFGVSGGGKSGGS
jgi:hypothetical protein